MERVLCPRHAENTPSCVIYPSHAWCYGGCGRIELSEIGRTPEDHPKERYKEDLVAARTYIDELPTKTIRGFVLPYDSLGYYLQFPDSNYYKRRNWSDTGSKYKNPSGHSQPPFWATKVGWGTLAFVEGELNALSIASAFHEWDVVSPGSASDFKKESSRSLLTYCTVYNTIVVIVDRDGPGTEAAIHAKGLLVGKVPYVHILLMPNDPNELLIEKGKDGLREEVERRLSEAL